MLLAAALCLFLLLKLLYTEWGGDDMKRLPLLGSLGMTTTIEPKVDPEEVVKADKVLIDPEERRLTYGLSK
jgi:hypothetical protein